MNIIAGDTDDMVTMVDGELKRGHEALLVDLLKLASAYTLLQSGPRDHAEHEAGDEASSGAAAVVSDNVGVLRVLR